MKIKWFILTRGTIHLQRFAMVLNSIRDNSGGSQLISPIGDVLYFNIGPKLWFAWNEKEINAYGQKLLEKIKSPQKFKEHYKNIVTLCKVGMLESEKIRNTSLSLLTNKQLASLYQELYQKTGGIQVILGADVDAIDIVFEPFLQKQLENDTQSIISGEKLNELYKKLSVPLHTTYVTAQHRDVLLAAKINSDIAKSALALKNKYWWTELGWENVIPHSQQYFIRQIKKASKIKNIQNRLREIGTQNSKVKNSRARLIKKYKISIGFKYLLNVLDRYAYLHDLRKEMQVKNVYAFNLLLKETAKRTGYKQEDLEWTWYEEAQKLLAGKKLDKKEVSHRKKALCIIVENHKLHAISGTAALQRKSHILKTNLDPNAEIKGLGVTTGIAKGRVKVCSGYKEALNKVKKGDILVTGMTLPDYVPAMKKAAAIVTDEGGITCHAAIVSRELKKVCIVGTKVATQILKDGDMVEVDANKGIVRIIK